MSGKQIYRVPFKITKDSTIQWFQTRINHKILATNTFLCKIKVTNDSRCTFCPLVGETIEYHFWECECVKKFLNEANTWLSHHINIRIALDEKSFLFGVHKDQENGVNTLVLMAIKYYINYSRCSKNNMNLTVLKHSLTLLYQTNKQASIPEVKYDAFQIKWQKYHDLFG